MVSLDDFKKLDLRVAKIISAEKVPDSENLLKLTINIGSDERQIVSGIAKFYAPEALVGRQIIIIANLEPKIFRGVESNGMLLAADNSGEPVILTTEKEVLTGAKIS